jgi:phosphatidylcholine synthase
MPKSAPTKRSGYAIHTLTASGAVLGMLALQSIFNGDVRSALIWLLLSQVLDGLDGPVARRFDVMVTAPRIDGHVLDLVVDYVTCVVVPIAFMIHFDMLPAHFEIALAGLTFMFSALWFSRTDLETVNPSKSCSS